MTDDMKDIGGLNSFMFNGNGINIMDMMDNGPTTNSNTNNNATNQSDHIKQESNMLPPDIGGNGHYNLPPSTVTQSGGVGVGGYPGFSISASPPQQSPMFMDSINPNNNHHNLYGLDNGHHAIPNQFGDSHHLHNNHNNSHTMNHNQFGDGLIKSRLLSTNNGANTIRPSNLPNLRRNTSAPSSQSDNNGTNINNLNSNVQYLKHSKSDPNHNNLSNLNNMNHILTPFDYPLSNPTINASSSKSGAVNHSSHNYYAQYISQQRHNKNTNSPSNIKQEHNNNKEIHSAPLYSIHSISSSLHNTNSNSSISSHSTHTNNNNTAHSHSLSTTPTKNNSNYNHFSLSSSLLNIPQHLTQNQHPSFPHSNPSCFVLFILFYFIFFCC